MDIDTNWMIRKSVGFELEKLETGYVIVNSQGVISFELNDTSALIWQLIDDQRTVSEIIHLLTELYPDMKPKIPEEAEAAMGVLLEHDVIYALA